MNENVVTLLAGLRRKKRRWRAPLPGLPGWGLGTDYIAVYYSPGGNHLPRCWGKTWALQPLRLCFWLFSAALLVRLENWRELSTIYGPGLILCIWSLWGIMRTDKEAFVFDSQVFTQLKRSERKHSPWSKHSWIVNWGGDVLFVSLWSATCIPCETFDSPEQAREFVELARQLKNHQGSVWPREWKSRIYGLELDDIEWKLIANVYKSRLME